MSAENGGYNIDFMPGEITAIMGQSGCGKTSLLYAIQGRSNLRKGTIQIGGYEPLTSQLSNVIAYVPQEDVMHTNLTVEETVFHSALARRLDDDIETIKCDVRYVLEQLGMTGEKLNNMTSTLSGGEKKRVNIAMEIAACPRILLLDEPTSGLDSTVSQMLFDFLSEIKRSKGGLVTIIMIIHQPSFELFNRLDYVMFITPIHCLAYQGTPQAAKPTLLQRFIVVPPDMERTNASDTCVALLPSITDYENDSRHRLNTNFKFRVVSYGKLKELFYPIGFLCRRTVTQMFLRENYAESGYYLGYFVFGLIVGMLHDYHRQSCNLESLPSLYFMITLSFGLTTCISSQRLFGVEMVDNTYVRETRTHYHPFQYWLAKSFVDLIHLIIYSLLYLALAYIIIVPRAGFLNYFGVVLLISFVCSGIGQLTSVLLPRTEYAYLAAALAGLFSSVLSGFSPTKDQLGIIVYFSFSRHAQCLLFQYDSDAYLVQDASNLWNKQIEHIRAYYFFGDCEHPMGYLLFMGTVLRVITYLLLYARSEYRSRTRHGASKSILWLHKTR